MSLVYYTCHTATLPGGGAPRSCTVLPVFGMEQEKKLREERSYFGNCLMLVTLSPVKRTNTVFDGG
jgi:hypothetical protein